MERRIFATRDASTVATMRTESKTTPRCVQVWLGIRVDFFSFT